ncbi:MAG: PQQ-dependent sugar dehydrogenase [Parcubacteria group bacterium]|nr:PQQ-dependent sugar dehydrogenase [Parcubacteria group bacterium]
MGKKIRYGFAVITFLLLPVSASAAVDSWQQGVTLRLRSQPRADVDAELRIIADDGVNFLTITPGWATDSLTSSNVYRKSTTPPDDLLIYTIDQAHTLGMRVMLKPHLDLIDYSHWRANIDPSNKAAFFANYKAMLLIYVDIASAHNVEQFAVGAELFKLTSNRANEPYWRDIISTIRSRYSGKLTYSAIFGSSRDELNLLPFWDVLDYVGLSAYQPLASNTTPTVEALKSAWANIEQRYIYPAYLKFSKPLLITEVGYKSIDGSAIKPEGNYSTRIDLQEQADLYQAFFEFWDLKDYFSGVHFWDWWPEPNRGGPTDKDFTPQDKPAEGVIQRFFGGIGTPPPSPWTFCANENQFCAFSGTRQVRYGANGSYFYKTFTNGTNCTNAVFGDPVRGVVKRCHYGDGTLPSPTPTPTPAPSPTPTPSPGGPLLATTVATGLDQPVVLATLADGRIFIGEKASGKIKIFRDGSLIPQSFFDIHAFIRSGTYFDTFSERGLLGLAFHPDFATDPNKKFLYVYYTLCKSPKSGGTPGTSTGCSSGWAKNRVSRFVVSGDAVDTAAGETIILDDIDSPLGYHNAGWIGFGPDRKLYISVGDGGGSANRINSQKITSLNGKILRVNDDGTIPPDNPWSTEMRYVSTSINPVGTSMRREIWAMGLRNPWRCRFSPDGKLYCGDVGEKALEEVDIIERGHNYGWPYAEGTICPSAYSPSSSCPAGLTGPIHTYGRTVGASITGGDFGGRTNFSGDNQQSYFFADYVGRWVKRLILSSSGTPVSGSRIDVLSDVGSIVDLIAGPDGALYYLDITDGSLGTIQEEATGNRAPVARAAANVTRGAPPLEVQFSDSGSFDPDGDAISYEWMFGDGAMSSDKNPVHTYASSGMYRATLRVRDESGMPSSNTATLDILIGSVPVVSILSPADNSTYQPGETIALSGTARDPDTGEMPSSALHWKIIQHHGAHTHPYIDDLVGANQSFRTDTATDIDMWFEIILSATDDTGLSSSASVRINPEAGSVPPPPSENEIVVYSPPDNSWISGEKKLKVYISGRDLSTYAASYNVDGRGEIPMTNASPYKQAVVQFDFWTWNGNGPYAILFTARDLLGNILDTASLTLFVKH